MEDPNELSLVRDMNPTSAAVDQAEFDASDDEETDGFEEMEELTDAGPAETDSPNVNSSAKISIPIYVKTPSTGEQLSIAFFPMSTCNVLPGSRIATVSRNNVDGRIRCEVKDSTIHGREETADGVPVDYHRVWESSHIPANTYRDDYLAVKQNGRLFLIPAQTVHMRTVVEPKSTRQSETQRIGIVVNNNSREAQNAAGKLAVIFLSDNTGRVRLIDWLAQTLTLLLFDRSIDRLIDWLICPSFDWSIDWLIDCQLVFSAVSSGVFPNLNGVYLL